MAHPFITDAQATQKIQESYNDIVNSIGAGFQGTITISDTPTENGIYIPTEAGVYPNAGGLEYAPEGDDEGFLVMFINNGTEWVKNSYPLGFNTDNKPVENSDNVVKSGGIYDRFRETYQDFVEYADGKELDIQLKPALTSFSYISPTGKLTSTSEFIQATHDFVRLSNADSLIYTGRFGTNSTRMAFYESESESSFISSFPNEDRLVENEEVQIPDGANFARFTYYNIAASPDFNILLKNTKVATEINLFEFRIVGTPTYENEAIKTSNIVWNDKSTGVVEYTDWDELNATYRGFTATSIENNKQVVQPSVSFDSDGQIVNYPNLIITNI